MVAVTDIAALTILLLLATLISPFAAYILSLLIYYVVPISSVIPYALLAVLWVMGFRGLWSLGSRYFMGFLGSVLLVISYFINVAYVAYVLIMVLMGKLPMPSFLVYRDLVLYQSRLILVLSLYLPLPTLISVLMGLVGSSLSLITLYRLGSDYSAKPLKVGSLLSILGALLIIDVPLIGGLILTIGLVLSIMGLGIAMNNLERSTT